MKIKLLNQKIDIDNIIFLDIDGVLNVFASSSVDFEQESIDTLNELYDKIKYKIVLSSSWKESWPIYYLQEMFRNIGIKAPLIATTNTYFDKDNEKISFNLEDIGKFEEKECYSREYEILQWVRLYKVEHFIILDDIQILKDELKDHAIWTLKNGLRKEHLNEMIHKIKIKSYF
jgi:hypothetical protein